MSGPLVQVLLLLRKRRFVFTLVALVLVATIVSLPRRQPTSSRVLLSRNISIEEAADLDHPILLWWSPVGLGEAVPDERLITCPERTCLVSHRRSLRNSSDLHAILFYGPSFAPRDLPLPRRLADTWALFYEEIPQLNWLLSYPSIISLFNITATVSRESHFPLALQYMISLETISQPPPVPAAERRATPLVHVLEHCASADPNADAIAALAGIGMDTISLCDRFPGYQHDPVVMKLLLDEISSYRFAVLSERTVCSDYMGPTLFMALMAGAVPVYFGSESIRDWFPSDSMIILPAEFSQQDELVQALQAISTNATRYEEFHAFRKATPATWTSPLFAAKYPGSLQHGSWLDILEDASASTTPLDAFECFVCDATGILAPTTPAHFDCGCESDANDECSLRGLAAQDVVQAVFPGGAPADAGAS
eukprot:m.36940 g.36940  ORF g.36940 m.36940 type:complete len:424 (+) comp5419_c0_seq1:31-1302(+)